MIRLRGGGGLARIAWGVALLACLAGCTPKSSRRGGAAAEEAALQQRYAAILDAYRDGRDEEARTLSAELLAEAPTFSDAPQLRLRLAESYLAESRWDLSLHQVARLLEDYPGSPASWEGELLKARALAGSGRRLDAATELDLALAAMPAGPTRVKGERLLGDLLEQGLAAGELEEFARRRPLSPQRERAKLALAERLLQEGQPDPARPLLEAVMADASDPALKERARDRLVEMGLSVRLPEEQVGIAPRPGLIGVLAPLSGRYSVYGEAFLDGARLALERCNREWRTEYSLVGADSEGEPVAAALACRRLVVEEGVSALLGGVLSNPTVAAAVEANARGVPLLSPSATAENIHQLGDWIFQNKISSEAQVLALARLAIFQLLGARFAVLYPRQGNGETLARVFSETIFELGGEIVASVSYEVGMTDFTEPLEAIRDAQPELLFLPGEVEQLILILPQLNYNGIHAQLLGNEAWNSRRLARQGGADVEGAVFPSDVLLKSDRTLYQEFLSLYEQRFAATVNPVAARAFLGTSTLLQIMHDGAASRAEVREQLSLRLADWGDESARREILAEQVTLMTIREGAIIPLGRTAAFDSD